MCETSLRISKTALLFYGSDAKFDLGVMGQQESVKIHYHFTGELY